MCRTCGCNDDAQPTLTDLQTGAQVAVSTDREHVEHHQIHSRLNQDLGQFHAPPEPQRGHGQVIHLEQELLAKNRLLAERNRDWLAGRDVLALNLISSPGAGKTTLLERTIRELQGELRISVIEGDQATLYDAERIRKTGCRVVQINTGAGCHLEAGMTARGLTQLDPPRQSVVLIENVGNLVCPALFDLGEQAKVVIMSVTDGDDKPVKYPHAFRASQLMILNKLDLLPYVQFNVQQCLEYARVVNPNIEALQVSATSGEGLHTWYDWLREQRLNPAVRRVRLVGIPA